MKAQRDSFYWGALAGMLLAIAAQSGNWLISGAAHPAASAARTFGVAVQGAVCLAAAIGIAVHHWRAARRPDAA